MSAGVCIAQISDLHFGREDARLVDALLDELHALSPTVVAVCGDLTQSAREGEFRAARRFVDALPTPSLVVPGNHDMPGWRVWSRFARPWRRWRTHLGDPHELKVLRLPRVLAVGVNTARRAGVHPDFSRGRIGREAIESLGTLLEGAAPGSLRVIVAHHPFLLSEAAANRGRVGRAARALRRLERRVDLLLGGHTHLGYSGVLDGVVVAQSGTAVSGRLKGEPNGYNLVRWHGATMEVELRRWDGGAFRVYERATYRRTGEDWHAAA